jgi:hypothetical protein
MTTPDHGVDLLLRRATEDLRPHVDQLVAGGITRGRAHRRRARIGTAVAAFTVFGVIGAAAAVVPQLGSSTARTADSGFASDSPTIHTLEVPPPVRTPVDAELVVPAADIPATVDRILGTTLAGVPLLEAPYGVKDEPRHKIVHFRYDGMLTSVVIEVLPSPQEACEGSVTCVEREDGSWQNHWAGTADGVTSHGATIYRHGYSISVLSYNAAEGKESPALAALPPLSGDQLLQVADSDVWFG